MHSPRRFRRRDTTRQGAAAVELAVLLPVLGLLLGGIVEFGSAFWVRHHMLQATREGTRILSLSGTDEQRAIKRARDYLGKHYPGLMEREAFAFSAGREGPSDREVFVEIRISYGDATILGGWVLPRDHEMFTRLYMERD